MKTGCRRSNPNHGRNGPWFGFFACHADGLLSAPLAFRRPARGRPQASGEAPRCGGAGDAGRRTLPCPATLRADARRHRRGQDVQAGAPAHGAKCAADSASPVPGQAHAAGEAGAGQERKNHRMHLLRPQPITGPRYTAGLQRTQPAQPRSGCARISCVMSFPLAMAAVRPGGTLRRARRRC